MSVSASKTNLVHELFVRTADENYITARWCATNRLNTDFLWLAVHALEKYLKAVLLVNGHSSKRSAAGKKPYSHDIVGLYADVKALSGPLLPSNLSKPAHLDFYQWFERTPEQFMGHLFSNGNVITHPLRCAWISESMPLWDGSTSSA